MIPKITFPNPDQIFLVAGGSVLDRYYGTNYAGDIDIFVPILPGGSVACSFPSDFKQIECRTLDKELSQYVSNVETVRRIASPTQMVDIVFLKVETLPRTREEFHKVLVANFDIKICSLSWDGERFYYPPVELANLETKTSAVRVPDGIDRLRDRITKYLSRGFTLVAQDSLL